MLNYKRFRKWLQYQLNNEDHGWLAEELEDFQGCQALLDRWFFHLENPTNPLYKNMPTTCLDVMLSFIVEFRSRVDDSIALLTPGGLKVGMPDLPMSQALLWRRRLDDAGVTKEFVEQFRDNQRGGAVGSSGPS